MNYYERHIGDYLKDTAHLSLLEHGVYTRLLDVYYTRESGIPDADAARLVGARSRDEKEALRVVLAEFFVLADGVHAQPRADREIDRFHGKQAKAKASADARWSAQRSQSERNANASPEHVKRNATGTEAGARPQTPATSNQTPLLSEAVASVSAGPTSKPPEKARLPACPHEQIVGMYVEILPELPGVRVLDDERRKAIRCLWSFALTTLRPDGSPRATGAVSAIEWVREFFTLARSNDFVMGRTERGDAHKNWRADIEYLCSTRGIKQVLEKTETTA